MNKTGFKIEMKEDTT